MRGLFGTLIIVLLVLVAISLFPTVMARLHPATTTPNEQLHDFFPTEPHKR